MKHMKIDPQDPLRCIPFRGDYGWRRWLDKRQWRARYLGILTQYRYRSYRLHNRFVVLPYVDEQGEKK